VIEAARERLPDLDLRIEMDTTQHNIRALVRRSLDAVFAFLPFDADEEPHYLALGLAELVLAIPANHRLAQVERIPRAELTEETFLISPRSANPRVADHVFLSVFGRLDPPNITEIADVGSERLWHVAQERGLALVAVPLERLHPIPGVVYRRIEDPVPTIEYGLVWFDEPAMDGLASFIDLARELAEPEELPSLSIVGE
jgi:DNA-binding transcriptional LysR family regulator